MPKFHPALRPIFAVYIVTISAMAFDFWLISAMPQGIHLTTDIIVSLAAGLVLTVGGLVLSLRVRPETLGRIAEFSEHEAD